MGAWLEDLRYSVRSLRKNLGLTCVAIVTLGLGIGCNTAIYCVINAFLLRPLPVRDPGQLVVLATRDKHTEVPHGMSFADYRDYRGLTDVFSGVLARREFAFATNWKRDHRTDRIWVDAITPNYFQLLGKAPFGRLVYPVPEKAGLGVHITLDLGGQARFGPDVEWIDQINYDVDPKRCQGFYAEIRKYWPELPDGALVPGYAGVRPKIGPSGAVGTDFVIQGPEMHGVPGLVNLFGIESPGLTASPAIAAEVAARLAA